MRCTVKCDGETVGHVELGVPNDGASLGQLEPLPAFERIRPILERAQRLGDEASDRLLEAMRTGTLPKPTVPDTPGEQQIVTVCSSLTAPT